MPVRLLLSLLVVATLVLPCGTAVALAEDGPSRLLSATGPLRPPPTVERWVNVTNGGAVFFVGGYGGGDGDYWDRLKAALPGREHVDVDHLRGYDARGSIDANGQVLAREVRRRVRDDDLDVVALVGVSMGGTTIARSGLTAADNVRTETMLGSPVNGSTTAAAVRAGGRLATVLGARDELAAILRPLGAGLDDPAMVDLAEPRRYSPPTGVRVTQFWSALDPLVAHRDATVPGHEVLTLGPFVANPHGGHAVDPRYLPAVASAVRGGTPAVDRDESRAASLLTPMADGVRLLALGLLAVAFLSLAVVLRGTGVVRVWSAIGHVLQRLRAWWS